VLFQAYLANLLDGRGLALVRAVGKVQADDIDAGADHVANDRLGVGGRPKRGDNFGATLRWGFRQIQVVERHDGGSEGDSYLIKVDFERVKVRKEARLISL
jgi:hypothetical protein